VPDADPLPGGTANRGLVLRIGDTVHRPLGPYSAAVHELLRHLESAGFSGSPRLLETYGQTEVLSYIDGSAPNLRPPDWALTDDALVTIAALLRSYHQHVADFEPRDNGWQRPVPVRWRGSLVTHNDTNPANIIFRDSVAVALIDFDLAAPGSISWELAIAGCFWAPLLDPQDIADSRQGRAVERFRLLLDSYGASPEVCWNAAQAAVSANDWIAKIIEDGSKQGHPGFSQTWTETATIYRRARQWIHAHLHELAERSRARC
jgi:Phosphotransferase enzyme family